MRAPRARGKVERVSDPPEARDPAGPLPWRGRLARWAPAAALALGVLLFASCVHRAGPSERTDLPVYLAAARELTQGRDPLGVTSRRGWPYVYPPTLAALLTPLLPLPQRAAAAVWFVVSLAAFAAGCLALRRALGRRGPFEPLADGAPLLLVLLPTASALLRGQVGPLLLGLAGGAALCLARRRDLTAGLLLALAAAIKLTPALALLGLVFARRWRVALGGALGLLLWLVLVPLPFLGPSGARAALAHFGERMVLHPLKSPEDPDITAKGVHVGNNQSLSSQVIRRVFTAPARPALLALVVALALAPALAVAARGPEAGASVPALGVLLAAPLVAAPVAWHHHHVLLLPALAALWLGRERLSAARPVLAAFAALSLLHFAIKPLRDLGLLGGGTLLVLYAAAALAWRAGEADAPGPEASAGGAG